ncbi:MAG TPA: hypothetical protein VHQ20_00090 [Patescibacteria group bacterium]|jgi:hypothetical protein|nr:hypothetical protein [Patescibacteria group bacterium]
MADATTIFSEISVRIIREQELIIGPVAWEEAQKVSGLTVSADHSEVSVTGEPKDVLNRLVAQYSRLFGKVSSEVCKEAAQDLLVELPTDQVPSSLQ